MSQHAVIGASRRGQLAKEGYEGHGVFTAALLRVLKSKPRDDSDKVLRVHHIWSDVSREVASIAHEMGGGYQQKVSAFVGGADFPLTVR